MLAQTGACSHTKEHARTLSDIVLRLYGVWRQVQQYAARMSRGMAWGGGIEMAVCSKLRSVNVHVYVSIHMSMHIYVHRSMHTSMHMSVHMCVHMSIRMSVHVSVHMSVHMSVRMSVHTGYQVRATEGDV